MTFHILMNYYHIIVRLDGGPPGFVVGAQHYKKIITHANKTAKFLNKIKSREIACSARAESIPDNATIRKEYVKCGKEVCEELHGPYYYAYWKDPESKKLKKKYIGTYLQSKDKSELKNNHDNEKIFLVPLTWVRLF
jgi:hypothetical protein